MIEVEDIHKSFDGNEVLRGVSFEVKTGEVLALIGRSGYGKSVFLKHLARLIRPDQGRILIDGHSIHDATLERGTGLVCHDSSASEQ